MLGSGIEVGYHVGDYCGRAKFRDFKPWRRPISEILKQMKRGFLNPRIVTKISFWTTSACILVAMVACLLAIWNFAGTDVLWRTVATCAVVGGGMIAFYVINSIFDRPSE